MTIAPLLANSRTHRVDEGVPVHVYITDAEIDGVEVRHIRVDSEGQTKLLPFLTVNEVNAISVALRFEGVFGKR